MKNKNILITGGAGFIGSNITKTLAKENNVKVIDNLSTGKIENIQERIDNEEIYFFNGSITDKKLLVQEMKDIDYVFHLAAQVSVPNSVKNPEYNNEVNINGTKNILYIAIKNNIKKVIFSSSCAVYGNPDSNMLPINEKTMPNPLSPYAESKLIGEKMCTESLDNHNLRTICLRYFNVYGPKQDPNGEYAAVIPKFILKLIQNKSPIIYGNGNQTRDFIYVEDIVNANLLAADSNKTGVYNIASGKSISINELADNVMDLIDNKKEIIYKEPRPGDIKYSEADITLVKNDLKFNPKYSITDGLKHTINWFEK